MKKTIFAALITILSFASCNTNNIVTVDADKFEELIKSSKVQLVDARTAEEYTSGKIPGAINIDVKKDDFKYQAKTQLSKDKPVAIYCRSGKRSLIGASILRNAKFKVVNLRGGIMEWEKAGKKISK
ncbi:MAG: rhodanese-like domain-containing protein [Prevotella sp.]|jgi:rhodanese-related sulfurtransferase|nr:rhodanese-like domain-containing protein [Prevotella sp.]